MEERKRVLLSPIFEEDIQNIFKYGVETLVYRLPKVIEIIYYLWHTNLKISI